MGVARGDAGGVVAVVISGRGRAGSRWCAFLLSRLGERAAVAGETAVPVGQTRRVRLCTRSKAATSSSAHGQSSLTRSMRWRPVRTICAAVCSRQ